jgi:dTDP-4-dehydrorhamnose 3,5-epimerase
MKPQATALPGVLLLLPEPSDCKHCIAQCDSAIRDPRIPARWAQNSIEYSRVSVVRGIHYQLPHPQGRLVGAVQGRSLHIAVDLRRSSFCFGLYLAQILAADRCQMLWIPEGFGHAWMALTSSAALLCKATCSDCRDAHRTIAWNDPDLGIPWPAGSRDVILGDEDRRGVPFRNAELFP